MRIKLRRAKHSPEEMGGNMAFTRSFLKATGLSDEQISAVMDAHTEVVDALKSQRDGYKAEAEKLPEIQKKLDEMGGEDYKAKYEKEHDSYEKYKAKVKADAETEKVRAAYRKLLADEKVSEKRLDAVMRLTDFSGMTLQEDGTLTDADKLRKGIRDEWSDYIVTEKTLRENVATPPVTAGGGRMSREDIFKRDEHGRYVHSTEERQKLIQENPQAFK